MGAGCHVIPFREVIDIIVYVNTALWYGTYTACLDNHSSPEMGPRWQGTYSWGFQRTWSDPARHNMPVSAFSLGPLGPRPGV